MYTERDRQAGLDFSRRLLLPRALGCGLSFLYIAAEILPDDMPGWVWGWMLVNGFCWPPLARLLAARSKSPYRTELNNLLIDSLFAGGWIAVMHLSLLPSALLLSMVIMNNVAAHGVSLMLKGLLANLLGYLGMGLLVGFAFEHQTTPYVVWACLPMLLLYPPSVGWTSYRLASRLAEQRRALSIVSSFDDSTRLLPRDAWMLALAREYHRCRARATFSTLGLIRIDEQTALSDRYGALAVKALLTRLAQLTKSEVRQADIVGLRQPGELAVIFQQTHASGARQCLERVAAHFGNFGEHSRLLPEVSIRVAAVEYSMNYLGEVDWLEAANEQLEQSTPPQQQALRAQA